MSDSGNSDTVKSPKFLDLKDFQGIKQKVEFQLRAPEGKRFWRSLDELSGTGEFRELMNREFPAAASEWDDGVSRRNFMKLMGASLALAGLTSACAPKPEEKIVPYVQQPEHFVPGKPLFFASAFPFGGYARAVLVEQHEGRPTKIEGNPSHPTSKGASDVWSQASILTMYDPDRSQVITRFGNVSSWGTFNLALADAITFQDWNGAKTTRRTSPARVRILTETSTSPTVAAQVAALKQAFPDLKWHKYDPVGRDNTLKAAKLAFGEAVEPIYDFRKAKVVVALESNFFIEDPGSLKYMRDFMQERTVRATAAAARFAGLDGPRMQPNNRLIAVESMVTNVGAFADHKLRVKPQLVQEFAAALYEAVAKGEKTIFNASSWKEKTKSPKKHGDHYHFWFNELVSELLEHKGESIVIAGEYAPVEVQVLAHAINAALGNISSVADDGKPVMLIPAVESTTGSSDESLAELSTALKAGEVDVLLVLGGNPAYTSPVDLDFVTTLKELYTTDAAGKIRGKTFFAHLGLYEDETARLAEWHLPEAYYLETWGDARSHDGTATVIQPLIAPLYPACKSTIEVLAAVLEQATPANGAATKPASPAAGSLSGYDTIRSVWRDQLKAGDKFEAAWTQSLHDGYISGTAFAPKAVTFKGDVAAASKPADAPKGAVINFRPDPHIWDGSFSNNAWMQELPKPLTKLTWDNALICSPRGAYFLLNPGADVSDPRARIGNVFKEKFAEANGRTVDITVNGRTLKGVPIWVLPGHADECFTLHLGYGRTQAGRVGSPAGGGVGFNTYSLRTAATRWNAPGATIATNGGSYPLAVTQNHQVINHELNHKRELVLAGNSIPAVAHHFEDELAKREGTLAADHKHPDFKNYKAPHPDANIATARRIGLPVIPDDPSTSPLSVFPEQPDHPNGHDPDYPAWGMVIDQTTCIGCNACIIACQAENNIPVVGKEQVMVEREMHWLRIDTYHVGGIIDKEHDEHGHANEVDIADPDATYFQPVSCMHCEKAPCEIVCPVGATIHSKEGLNDMAYNRCVGTRYCSNNCPYKVRRFNFLKFNDDATPVLKLLRNPEVTVRSRGVMEKCTYCTQRISRGRIEAKKAEVALLAKGVGKAEAHNKFNEILRQIQAACEQACPTTAIGFGNMFDADAPVTAAKREPVGFHYGLLAELNTRPRTSYLARIEKKYDDWVVGGHDDHGDKHDH